MVIQGSRVGIPGLSQRPAIPGRGLSVYFAPVAYANHEDGDSLILDFTDKAIVPHAVFPEPGHHSFQGFAVPSWTLLGCHVSTQIFQNALLNSCVELPQIAPRSFVKFNPPGQGPAPTLPGSTFAPLDVADGAQQ